MVQTLQIARLQWLHAHFILTYKHIIVIYRYIFLFNDILSHKSSIGYNFITYHKAAAIGHSTCSFIRGVVDLTRNWDALNRRLKSCHWLKAILSLENQKRFLCQVVFLWLAFILHDVGSYKHWVGWLRWLIYWLKRFRTGQESLEDDARTARTVKLVHRILHNRLGMRKVSAIQIPKHLSPDFFRTSVETTMRPSRRQLSRRAKSWFFTIIYCPRRNPWNGGGKEKHRQGSSGCVSLQISNFLKLRRHPFHRL